MVIRIIIISLSLASGIICRSISHDKQTKPNECVMQSEQQLSAMFAKAYESNIDWILNGKQYDGQNRGLKIYDVEKSIERNASSTIGEKACSRTKQTIWDKKSNIPSVCPHHFIEVNRVDRFPFKIFEAVCNCQHCIKAGPHFSCLLDYIVRPVLIREKCKPNNQRMYGWKNGFERVAIGCSCKEEVILN